MYKKILIMSASTGGGHNKAANAIKETIESINENIECEIIDSLKFVNNAMDKVISSGYEKSAIYTPKAYGRVYKLSDINLTNEFKGNPLAKIMARKFRKLLKKSSPDLIIGTHPFPMISLSDIKKSNLDEESQINIPTIISLLTDYTTHSTWVQNEVDYYIVANEFVKELLVFEGISEEIIKPFGIPVEKSFFETNEKEIVFNEMNLDPNKFTVLLMGGSFGAGGIKDALDELIETNRDFQIIVVTGKNESLKEKLTKKLDTKNKNIHIVGYINNMNDLLAHVDVLITKPGGLTITEALIKNTPMIIPYSIPGQEDENLDFLLNFGVALKPTKKISLSVLINYLIDNPKILLKMKDNINLIKKEDTSIQIKNLVEDILYKKN
ncbi:MAG: glycosyltransferase [Peptostreptococcaceae bacterium]